MKKLSRFKFKNFFRNNIKQYRFVYHHEFEYIVEPLEPMFDDIFFKFSKRNKTIKKRFEKFNSYNNSIKINQIIISKLIRAIPNIISYFDSVIFFNQLININDNTNYISIYDIDDDETKKENKKESNIYGKFYNSITQIEQLDSNSDYDIIAPIITRYSELYTDVIDFIISRKNNSIIRTIIDNKSNYINISSIFKPFSVIINYLNYIIPKPDDIDFYSNDSSMFGYPNYYISTKKKKKNKNKNIAKQFLKKLNYFESNDYIMLKKKTCRKYDKLADSYKNFSNKINIKFFKNPFYSNEMKKKCDELSKPELYEALKKYNKKFEKKLEIMKANEKYNKKMAIILILFNQFYHFYKNINNMINFFKSIYKNIIKNVKKKKININNESEYAKIISIVDQKTKFNSSDYIFNNNISTSNSVPIINAIIYKQIFNKKISKKQKNNSVLIKSNIEESILKAKKTNIKRSKNSIKKKRRQRKINTIEMLKIYDDIEDENNINNNVIRNFTKFLIKYHTFKESFEHMFEYKSEYSKNSIFGSGMHYF